MCLVPNDVLKKEEFSKWSNSFYCPVCACYCDCCDCYCVLHPVVDVVAVLPGPGHVGDDLGSVVADSVYLCTHSIQSTAVNTAAYPPNHLLLPASPTTRPLRPHQLRTVESRLLPPSDLVKQEIFYKSL